MLNRTASNRTDSTDPRSGSENSRKKEQRDKRSRFSYLRHRSSRYIGLCRQNDPGKYS